jgi:hypothetical protein
LSSEASIIANPRGESNGEVLKLDYDRRLVLQFRGSVVASDTGLLPCRELDDVIGLTRIAGETLADARTGKNRQHALVGMLRQSVFGRLAGYEGVDGAERLRHDPAMRWIVGGKAASGCAASASQMGWFERRWLTAERNLSALDTPTSRAWPQRSLHVEGLTLPKSFESDRLFFHPADVGLRLSQPRATSTSAVGRWR